MTFKYRTIDPYYLPTPIFPVATTDSDILKELLHVKIAKRKKQIHPVHNPRFNHNMQLKIDCIEWALQKIEVEGGKKRYGKLEGHFRMLG